MSATIHRVDQPQAARNAVRTTVNVPKKKTMRSATREARQIIAENLPGVIRTLAEKAIAGDGKASDSTHLKLFLEVSGVLKAGLAAPPRVQRERSLEEIFSERWEQDKLERAELLPAQTTHQEVV